jgi:hypothetical protein
MNILDMVRSLGEPVELVRLEQLNSTYRFNLPRFDQTLSPVAECGIEFILRKRTGMEIADRGRWRRSSHQPSRELKVHLNQYRDDLQTLKKSNDDRPPFTNDSDL